MDAKIIQFPGIAQVEQPEITPEDDAFDEWYEQNLLPLVGDVEELDRLALDEDHTDFWTYARYMREAINAWPIPEQPQG